MKKLSEIIKNMPIKSIIGNPDTQIRGIAYDSRQIGKDFVFVAIKGQHLDGNKFIPDAVKSGASVVLVEEQPPLSPPLIKGGKGEVTQVIVPDVREAMAKLSAVFYGEPSKGMTLIGVTGTNGKTTTTYLIESILTSAGLNPGVIGTVNYRYNGSIFDAAHTTPEASDLQLIFRNMADSGVTHCVMEVSSHALAQKRVDGSRFIGAAFTNLTQDHLDYHKTMDDYFKSKRRLFTDFIAKEEKGFSVINIDDEWGRNLMDMIMDKRQDVNKQRRIIRYSLNGNSEVAPKTSIFSERGIEASLNTPIGFINISSPLLGEYNLQNIMAAVGVGVGLGLDKGDVEKGINNLKLVRGRLERIVSREGFQAIVDYAHTGDALERVLKSLRPLTKGRLITVFGCGGDRDRGKRPIMGETATRLSDFTIVTSDNPRSEDAVQIIKEIERGINTGVKGQGPAPAGSKQGSGVRRVEDFQIRNQKSEIRNAYTVIPDRHEAIRVAVNMAVPQDIILIAGKGHEDYQIIGDRKFPFDDVKEIKKAMAEREAMKVA